MACFLHPMVPSHLRCPSYIIPGISNHSMQNNFLLHILVRSLLFLIEISASVQVKKTPVHYDRLFRETLWKWKIVMRALTGTSAVKEVIDKDLNVPYNVVCNV